MSNRIPTTFPVYGVFYKVWANKKLSPEVWEKAVKKFQELNPELQYSKGQTFEFNLEDILPQEE